MSLLAEIKSSTVVKSSVCVPLVDNLGSDQDTTVALDNSDSQDTKDTDTDDISSHSSSDNSQSSSDQNTDQSQSVDA
jgi:hypothetical protein